jgi:AraC-like DNA-binding protein
VYRYFVIPRPALQAYVDRFWGWESPHSHPLPPMPPGTGAELIFRYGDPVQVHNSLLGTLDLGEAFLPATRRGLNQLLPQGRIGFISVRFRSGALRHFSPLPLSALAGHPVAATDIWGCAGRQITEAVVQAPDRATRVKKLEDWLLDCLARYGKQQPGLETALRALYYHHASTRIDPLVDAIGMSRRHFERLFSEQIGLSPKVFQRTARFQQTLRDTLLTGRTSYLDAALAHGYYDQSHFIHDFKSFVGQSPRLFLTDTQRMAHFYNTPIFTPDKVPLPR